MAIALPSASAPQKGLASGATFLVGGIAVFSLQDIAIKWMSGDYPVHQIVFIRSVASLPLIIALLYFLDGRAGFATKRTGLECVRAALMFISYTTYYLALAVLPMADAVSLFYTGPIFIAIFSGPFLREHVRPVQWLTILVGFAGVVIVADPTAGILNTAAVLAVFSAAAYALGQITARKLGTTDSAGTMALFTTGFYVVASGLLGLFFGNGWMATGTPSNLAFLTRPWIWPSLTDAGLMLGLGVIATIGFYCLAKAYSVAQPKAVTPFEYTALIWGFLWGYLFFGEVPTAIRLTGIALIALAGVIVLLQGQRSGSHRHLEP
ncbi:drug/metabolite transporter (DMT)-like permease [Rhodoligotrophos appendicifer]|uniref:DMT family transporter n=1 Tax=Rhodoligotrophos appendicifer TaxID=987056 RepID=UPI001185C257|nr:DMT family transporter [Rhodoligotrophos appendicifer]